MQWHEIFDRGHEPSDAQIREFVDTPLFDELDGHLRETYKVKPKLAYSGCAMDGGMWKVCNMHILSTLLRLLPYTVSLSSAYCGF